MNDVEAYLTACTPERKEKLTAVIRYIRENYPEYEESCYFARQTRFPMFKDPNSANYVAVASMKAYISIHFGRHDCAKIVAEADKRIKTGVGCAKIPDKVDFPISVIEKAIDTCFRI